MKTSEIRTQVRETIKGLGLKRTDVSISVYCTGLSDSIRIQLKNENVNGKMIQDALNKFQSYERDEMTGEILSGGNTFVFIVDMNGRTRNY